jgi:hypothetical protein
MKLQVEIKDMDKTTVYSMDLSGVEHAAKSVESKVESFLKATFKKETFTRKDIPDK